jgi:PAS domain S-box-containing protein
MTPPDDAGADAIAVLRASERRFRVLADAMPQMVWSTRPDGFHDYYNERWYEFTGVPRGSTDGEGWNDLFHPDDRERAWAAWRHSLATGEPYEIEYRLRHRSGEYRWTLGRALPLRDETGAIERWFGTCTDIHALKSAEAAHELLARELSHRIKNIFAVVMALVTIAAGKNEAARAIARTIRHRIDALARAHDYVRPQIGDAAKDAHTVFGLARVVLAPYETGAGQRFTLSGADARLGPNAATALALILHEKATNAVKYGGLALASGSVEVDGALQGSHYELVWTERGGPAVTAAPEREGFGGLLASRSVAQLGGAVHEEWRPEGLVMRLRAPLKRLEH